MADDPVVAATRTDAALRRYLDGAEGEFRTRGIPPTELQFARGARWFAGVAICDSGEETTGSLRDQMLR